VVAPDLRGHGGSSAPGPFGLAELAGDLATLLDALRLERAALVGWSLGAQVALAALPRLEGRISALVLLSATPRFTAAEGWTSGLPARSVEVLAQRVRRDTGRAVSRFFDGMFADGELDPAARARLAALRAGLAPPSTEAALAGLEILSREDLRPLLAATRVPSLVVHGELDPICPVAAGRVLAAAIPGAELHVVEGAGHAPFLSRPDEVRGVLLPFLDAHR
jgi:pimeloyl-[acyl-carrier protein] methyl ester esterase